MPCRRLQRFSKQIFLFGTASDPDKVPESQLITFNFELLTFNYSASRSNFCKGKDSRIARGAPDLRRANWTRNSIKASIAIGLGKKGSPRSSSGVIWPGPCADMIAASLCGERERRRR